MPFQLMIVLTCRVSEVTTLSSRWMHVDQIEMMFLNWNQVSICGSRSERNDQSRKGIGVTLVSVFYEDECWSYRCPRHEAVHRECIHSSKFLTSAWHEEKLYPSRPDHFTPAGSSTRWGGGSTVDPDGLVKSKMPFVYRARNSGSSFP
jgi:hypothetical protein